MNYEEKGDCRSKTKMLPLPHQTVQIFFQGDQYDRDYKTEARRHYYGTKVEEYIEQKMDLSSVEMR